MCACYMHKKNDTDKNNSYIILKVIVTVIISRLILLVNQCVDQLGIKLRVAY